jgi:hypothetical protein
MGLGTGRVRGGKGRMGWDEIGREMGMKREKLRCNDV